MTVLAEFFRSLFSPAPADLEVGAQGVPHSHATPVARAFVVSLPAPVQFPRRA
jgi:hypothetical protein